MVAWPKRVAANRPQPFPDTAMETDLDDSSDVISISSSQITGNIKPDTDPLVDHDPLEEPFARESWYDRQFYLRADEEMNPVNTCEVPRVLQELRQGETVFEGLRPHEIEQLQGAGVTLTPIHHPRSAQSWQPEYVPDFSLPLHQRLLGLLDHMDPGFKKILC